MFKQTKGESLHPSETSAPEPRSQPVRSAGERPASLGPSISLTGNLTGSEDLIIEGSVEGEIMVRDHMVTISESGSVKADIYGRSICVEGKVDGNLVGDEQVVIRRSGRVRGNVTAPRVNLENGAKFKGSIDMQPGSSNSGKKTDPPGQPTSKAPAKAEASGSAASKPTPRTTAATPQTA